MTGLPGDRPPRHRRPQVVWLMSGVGNVGRTAIVANVSWMLASTGRRVLVLDAGTRRPEVSQYFPFAAGRFDAVDVLGEPLSRRLPVAFHASAGFARPDEPPAGRRFIAPGEA